MNGEAGSVYFSISNILVYQIIRF